MATLAEDDPRRHTQKMEARFHDIAAELRQDGELVKDPKVRALLITAAEVIGGLEKAFHNHDKTDTLAWG